MKSIMNSDFAYLIGNFLADGSLYLTDKGHRFEFVDGSSYPNELFYSREHVEKIKKIIENFLDKELPPVRLKGNLYLLKFRNKELATLFINKFGFEPGPKHKVIDIPDRFKNTKFEVDFWVGFLDGDGSIARRSRRIAVESMSKKIILSFSNFLERNGIYSSFYKNRRPSGFSYVSLIRAVSFRDFANILGFRHPLKSKLLNEKLRNNDFFVRNNLSESFLEGHIIDYTSIFDDTAFVENGADVLRSKGNKSFFQTDNVRLSEFVSFLFKKGLSRNKILKILSSLRLKKSKGSNNSVKLPYKIDKDLLKIAKFVRLRRGGGITFSKVYISSFNENYGAILKVAIKLFDIKPTYTCKREPLFCSGILYDFFAYLFGQTNLNKENLLKLT